MNRTRRPAHRSLITVGALMVAGAALTGAALTACTPQAEPTKSPRPTTSTPAPTPTTSSTPTASATPTGTPTPVSLSCDQVISLQQLYDFNPNFGVNPGYSPAAGSLAARAVASQGVACSWMNQTSNETIDVSVAKPAPEELAALTAEAQASATATDAFGAPGYFAASGGAGTAQVFTNGYWVTATSVWFEQPGDAGQIVSDVLGNLP